MDEFNSLVDIVAKLRSKNGCRWDKAQKLEDLKRYLLEEVYELLDIINTNRHNKIKEEIGDIILLLVFLCQLYKEKNKFGIKDSLCSINKKMIKRHPHVFSSRFKRINKLGNKEEIVRYWIKEKAREKKRTTVFERLPKEAPSLLLAHLLYKERKYYLDKGNNVKGILFQLKKEINNFKIKNRNENKIVKVILLLAELAFVQNLNLEILLKKEIFKRAKSIKY